MTDLKKAAQQALEALEEATNYTGCEAWSPSMTDECLAVAVTLRAALEQPEQEPVAWMSPASESMIGKTDENGSAYHIITTSKKTANNSVPLYTHPPRREWRGLTNLEFVQIELKLRKYHDYDRYDLSLNEFGRAIEAALKERNA